MAAYSAHSYQEIVDILDDHDHPKYNALKQIRSLVKCVNFGILYGVGPGTLINLVGKAGVDLTYADAEDSIYRWKTQYPGVVRWMRQVEDEVIENGYLTMVTGRRRTLLNAERKSGDGYRALRQATNAPVQGTASDLTLTAMYLLHKEFQGKDTHLLLNVHDQVGLEFKEKEYSREGITEVLQQIMEVEVPREFERRFDYQFTVPLKIDHNVGERWS
jgi:DNA polymerase-1